MAELTPLQRAFLALEQTRAQLDQLQARQREPIAIVGMSCRFPGGATDPQAFWTLLDRGESAITGVPDTRWTHAPFLDTSDAPRPGTTYARHAGFLSSAVDHFDAAFFGISPREAAAMDPQQRLLLEVSWEALECAGIAPDQLDGSATGVFVGIPSGDYAQLQLRGGTLADIDAHHASGIAHSIAAGRLSYCLGLRGPSVALDTACSSSLVAVHMACQSLRAHECDLSLAAGVNLILSPESFIAFGRTHMLAADGRCKVFDDAADGFVRGEGCGVVVLKRLGDAVEAGDRILAVIRGSAVNQDGASASLTAPSGPAQEAVIRSALSRAALAPGDVQFVEAHGTGTALGDPIELRALGAVYGASRAETDALIVGSVKANVGHLEGAAGVASLIKTVLALQAGRIPRQLHVTHPTSHVAWDALRLRLPAAEGEVWPLAKLRRAGISGFGFSGTNAHVIVEAPPPPVPTGAPSERAIQIIPIAARTASAARRLAERYADVVTDSATLADVAYTAATGRAQLQGARSAIVTDDAATARTLLGAVAAGEQLVVREAGTTSRAAFLFTGQGSQWADMGRELFLSHPEFRASLDASAAVLDAEFGGVRLQDVLYGPDAARWLTDARYVQPALVALELALATLWRSWGVEPVMVAGHSLGEYAAAVVAGVMPADDALRLVALRGRLMSELPPVSSAMTTVPSTVEAVRDALGPMWGETIELAADNGSSQCVLVGLDEDIARAESRLRERLGIASRRLAGTTNAFHSRFIEPMLDQFEAAAQRMSFAAPRVPVIWNLGASALAPHQAPTAQYWRRQTRHTVQFGEVTAALRARNVTHAIEIGPHPVLTGLVAAEDVPGAPVGVASLRRGRGAWDVLAAGVARWWQDGGTVNWKQYHASSRRTPIDLPSYPFEGERHWLDTARIDAPARRESTHTHPLVGTRVTSPALDAVVFERAITVPDEVLLDQHRIRGRATLPGAAWLDAMVVAARQIANAPSWAVCDLTLHAPLQLGDAEQRVVQLVLQPALHADADARVHGLRPHRVRAYSRDGADAASAWTLHADARLEPGAPAPEHRSDLLEWRSDASMDRRVLYERFGRVGLSLGASFQRLDGSVHLAERALASVNASDVFDWDHGVVHPTLLDACIQSIALAVPPGDDDVLYMPFAVEHFQWFSPTPERFVCEAVLRPSATHGETLVADVTTVDVNGRVVGLLSGITLKRVSVDALSSERLAGERLGVARPGVERLRDTPAVDDDVRCELRWEQAPWLSGTHSASGSDHATLETILGRLTPQATAQADATALDRYVTDGPAVDRLAAHYVWRALAQLGAPVATGDRFNAGSLATQLAIPSRYEQQWHRLLDILTEDEVLARDDAAYVVRRPLDTDTIATQVDALRQADTPFTGELELLVRCGEQLTAVLRGALDPLALLFPEGSLDVVHRIYRDSPFPRTYNALVCEAVAALRKADATTNDAQHAAGAPRRMRVLEVGGGTGGTTAAILEAIPEGACEYVFTDASPLFLTRARERFAHRADVTYQLFDLEQHAEAQGIAGTFDLIVAANVVHATRDVGVTLHQLRALLRPGGALLMLEMSRPSRWVDLSFGFTEGWWSFADAFRTSYPLLSPPDWQRALQTVGFGEIGLALGTPGSGDGLEEQCLILARTRPDTSACWVVLSDEGTVGAGLARHLAERGDRVTLIGAPLGTPVSDVAILGDITIVPSPDGGRAALTQLLTAVSSQQLGIEASPVGIIDLRALDASVSRVPADDTPRAASRVVNAALVTAQAVLSVDAGPATSRPSLCYLTQSAVRIDAADGAPSLPQAGVWGLARTLHLEHPELKARCIDVPTTLNDDLLAALADEIRVGAGEPQVALRADARWLARLDRVADRAPAYPTVYQVAPRERGRIDALNISETERPTPGPGQILIRVLSSGLNFKDVLNVLGTYPGDPGPIGGECAGVVVAVGDGVTSHGVGDRVVALAAGAMGSHVTAPASLAAPIPDRMSFDIAAALPIAYLTAHHALVERGQLRAGERVLIHAGAGGVGLAAIRVAQRVGADVYATAGSETKRAFLRDLGVGHVFDSRRVSFADELLACTSGEGVHVTLNSLANEFVQHSLACTAHGGRFLEIGKRGIWTPDEVRALKRDIENQVIDWTDLARTQPDQVGANLRAMLSQVAEGALPTLPVEVVPLSQLQHAFRHMAQGRHIGKIVISHREAADAAAGGAVTIVPGAAYLVAGGTGGIGLLTAEWLADRGASHIVLCSRRGRTDETDVVLNRLTSRGVRVDVHAVDIANPAAVEAMLDTVRTISPLREVSSSQRACWTMASCSISTRRVSIGSSPPRWTDPGTCTTRPVRIRSISSSVLPRSRASSVRLVRPTTRPPMRSSTHSRNTDGRWDNLP